MPVVDPDPEDPGNEVVTQRRFRFGVTSGGVSSGGGWRDFVRRVEGLGYSTLFVPDHFRDQLAPLAALAAAAMVTEELRLGTLVLSNDFRHPAVMAKEAATVDALSGGRLELGVGAGWASEEYGQIGMSFDPPGVRLDRLFEAVRIVRDLLAGDEVDVAGEHYTLRGLNGQPSAQQKPHPPLLIGGGGPRILRFAAREADIVGVNIDLRSGVNLNPTTQQFGRSASRSATTDAVQQRIAWIREAAGERYDDIELNVRVFIAEVTPDRRSVATEYAERLEMPADVLLESPHALIGSPDQLVDDLLRRRERFGLSYVVVPDSVTEAFAPVVDELSGR